MNRVQIISDKNQKSLKIKSLIQKKIKQNNIKRPNITIVIGGDGFMLQTLKKNRKSKKFFDVIFIFTIIIVKRIKNNYS